MPQLFTLNWRMLSVNANNWLPDFHKLNTQPVGFFQPFRFERV